jgi:hypothetical protein
MKYNCPLFFVVLILFGIIFIRPSFTHAAAPDGSGPWADTVVSSSQTKMKNGGDIPVIRSNPQAAVGIAESTDVDGTFFSLGFGGNIVLGFENGVSGGALIVEATRMPYPTEKAEVSVSSDGITWVLAGIINQDGQVPMPESVSCARYVRIKDISNKDDFSDDTADGFDVDGVKSEQSKKCTDGNGGTVIIDIDNSDSCIVKQGNVTVSQTSVVTTALTGNNKIKKTTGGKSSIKTGSVKSKTTVKVQLGVAIQEGSGCCSGCNSSSTTVVISGNG